MGRNVKIGLTRSLFDKDGNPKTPGPGLQLIDDMAGVGYEIFKEDSPEVTPEQIKNCDIVISLSSKWTKETLRGNERLLAVLRSGTGYDMVDVPALSDAGVMLCNTPQALAHSMAIGIVTFLLALSKRLIDKYRIAREGRWTEAPLTQAREYFGYGLAGKTLGSIGVGNIGREMFRLVKPFGMKHIAYDPYVKKESLAGLNVKLLDMNTVLAQSDYLNISCPLTEETRGLISENELNRMKETAFLINTARGKIINEAALIRALQKGWIRGAALDVFEKEPTPPDNSLLKMDNVIATPHAIGWTDQQWKDKWDENMKQLSQIVHGEIPNSLINRDVLDSTRFKEKQKRFREEIES